MGRISVDEGIEGMTNVEIQMTNGRLAMPPFVIRASSFGFLSSFEFRHSSFPRVLPLTFLHHRHLPLGR